MPGNNKKSYHFFIRLYLANDLSPVVSGKIQKLAAKPLTY